MKEVKEPKYEIIYDEKGKSYYNLKKTQYTHVKVIDEIIWILNTYTIAAMKIVTITVFIDQGAFALWIMMAARFGYKIYTRIGNLDEGNDISKVLL